jgi:prolyl-tRNA editing enzyme YbaK/EbsC (Cys-tRNA(Pro) deacylase)
MSLPLRLKSFLDSNYVPYESLSHSSTYTAQGTATLMQIPGKEVAKTVVLRAGPRFGETLLAVLPCRICLGPTVMSPRERARSGTDRALCPRIR